MGERIRNALFNSLSDSIVGAQVLDAFAGTGSLGIEALSRGAAHATFVERDRIALKILTNNIHTLAITSSSTVIRTTVANWLATTDDTQFDIIFSDPPYHDPQPATVAELRRLLAPTGTMIVSWPKRLPPPEIPGLQLIDTRTYSEATLNVYRVIHT
jgi:16S rRNA (guanine966-N2)-methyltransferase